MKPNPTNVTAALESWRRHRRNGTMPPIRTMETIVGAAKAWSHSNKLCPLCDDTGCVHKEDSFDNRIVAGALDPCCPRCL